MRQELTEAVDMLARYNPTIWLITFALLGIISCGVSSISSPSSDYGDSDDTESEPLYIATESVESTNNDPLSTAGPLMPPNQPTGADVFEQTDVPVYSGERLDDVFQRIKNETTFALSAPQDTLGFDLFEVRIIKQFGFTSVVAFFGSSQKYIYFIQGDVLQRTESCEDLALPPPPSNTPPEPTPSPVECSSQDLDLGNISARLLYIRHPMKNVLETHVIWDQDGIQFELGGDNIDGHSLVDIASSVKFVP